MRSSIYLIIFAVLPLFLIACQSGVQVSRTSVTDTVATAQEVAARQQATFPAQQRAPGDVESIARGKVLFGINCRSCHGSLFQREMILKGGLILT